MFQVINWELVAPLLVVQIGLQIITLVDLVKSDEIRGPKSMWAVVIIFGMLLGPVVYLIFGKKT